MNTTIATVALAVAAVAAPLGTAQASGNVTIRFDTPEFGIRIGTPVRVGAPAMAPPAIVVPAPVYVAPAVPRVFVAAPVYYPVYYVPVPGHAKKPFKHQRGYQVLPAGYAYRRD